MQNMPIHQESEKERNFWTKREKSNFWMKHENSSYEME